MKHTVRLSEIEALKLEHPSTLTTRGDRVTKTIK